MCFKHPLSSTRCEQYVITKEILDKYFEIDRKYLNDEITSKELLKEYGVIRDEHKYDITYPESTICYNYNEELFRYCLSSEHVNAMKKLVISREDLWMDIIGRIFCWFCLAPDRTDEEIETFLKIIVDANYKNGWWLAKRCLIDYSTVEELKSLIIRAFILGSSSNKILTRPNVFHMTQEQLDVEIHISVELFYSTDKSQSL